MRRGGTFELVGALVVTLTSPVLILRAQPATAPTTAPTTVPALAPVIAPTTGPTTISAGTPVGASDDDAAAARMKALIAAAATRAAAATAPSFVTTPPKPMGNDFAVVRSRSIFLRGRALTSGAAGSGATTRETPRRAEDTLIFNGASDADGAIVAFVEDTAAGRVNRVKVGDAIARGKVVRITLNQLEYESAGKLTTIEIGQNLSGVAATGGLTVSPTSMPLSDDPNDVVSRMRRARMEGR